MTFDLSVNTDIGTVYASGSIFIDPFHPSASPDNRGDFSIDECYLLDLFSAKVSLEPEYIQLYHSTNKIWQKLSDIIFEAAKAEWEQDQ